jgi:hypothetical protein
MMTDLSPFSVFVGVDVSKAKLDFAFANGQETFSIDNTPQRIVAELMGRIKDPPGHARGHTLQHHHQSLLPASAEARPPGPVGTFTRPDLAIPRQVARQQSLTPFHQAKPVYSSSNKHSFVLPCLRKRTSQSALDQHRSQHPQNKEFKNAF